MATKRNKTIRQLIRKEQERQVNDLGNGGPLQPARNTVARHIRGWRKQLGAAKVREILSR